MKKQIYDIVFEAQYEGLTTKEATDKLLLLFSVSRQSEQLDPYEPDNFPKCKLCKSIHDPEMCCQD